MPSLDIAVIGMAALFPGARDLANFWSNIRAGHDAIADVPAGRWDPSFYDPTSASADRLYCRRGGFIDAYASFDPVAFGVMPVAARGAEPDQLLALDVASRALADAGYDRRSFARDKAGVILGRGNYAGVGRTRLEQHIRTAEQLVACLRSLVPGIGAEELARVKKEFQAQLPAAGAEVAIGLVPNLTASRIAHRLDFAGPAFTVDAACASSLVAIDQACHELVSGRTDLMLVGGVHLCHDETFWSVFCQLGALSRTQSIRPFDRRADGLLIGEGIGVVVLKRRVDAERDDDRIYAVVRGTGVASDGHETSLVAPRVEGQVLALERAWKEAEVDPATIGVLEAHGTATPAGDAAELETLRRVFGAAPAGSPRAVVGSVKSMIGHAMPAAGVAGFVKAVLALHERVLPPTLHCEQPSPKLEGTRFRVVGKEEPWESTGPRRAGVNAFGFGGINAHVVLEEYAAGRERRARAVGTPAAGPSVAMFAANTAAELLAALHRGREAARPAGTARLAVIDPTPERLARAREVVEKGRPWRGREGIWFTPSGLVTEGGKIALLYPGVDATFEPKVDDVAHRFGVPVPACTAPRNLEELGYGIIGVNRLLSDVLADLRVPGDFVAGHSIGEWSGMIASGMIPERTLEEFIASLHPGSLEVPGVAFAAAGCGVEAAREAIEGLSEIDVSHDNCPHQILLCGHDDSIDTALARLREAGVLCQKLPFRSGFHSRLFASYIEPHRAHFARLTLVPPRVPLWSATTCAPYPTDADGIRALALEHLVRPVRFRELVEALHEAGARVFVQVGTGSLVQFVEDTLRGRPHVAISANSRDRSGLDQLRRLAAALFVEGVDVRLSSLFAPSAAAEREPLRLALGVPLVKLTTPLSLAVAPSPPKSAASGPLAAEFAASLAAVSRAQTEVMAALEKRAAGRSERETVTVTTLSIASMPELRDHSFFRQPPGWPTLSDLHPVVPMTTSIELMKEAAERLVPDRKVIAIEDVRAYRWVIVSQPLEVRIKARYDGAERVSVSIEDYADATCILGSEYPPAPPADTEPLERGERAAHTARQLYDDRWMFHGPAFQGVVDVGVLGASGIRGEIATPAAKGALLDNAGQLFGYWVMRNSERDRLAMPVRIQRLTLYGPHPRAGERIVCTAHVTRFAQREVVANISLDGGGAAWARIEGWEDRRFDTDDRLWAVMLYPEKNLLSEPQPGGYVLLTDRYRSAPTRDQLARRFLGEKERAECDAQGPRRQRAWLAGRIAAKDAVRDLLWKKGVGTLYPVEVSIETGPNGRPTVRAPVEGEVRVSIAHKDELAVAMASLDADVGIDIERVDVRPDGFTELAFVESELALMASSENRDEWLTKLWVAKEASAKASGAGLSGDPKRFPITDRAQGSLFCAGRWIELRRFGDYVIGWTVA